MHGRICKTCVTAAIRQWLVKTTTGFPLHQQASPGSPIGSIQLINSPQHEEGGGVVPPSVAALSHTTHAFISVLAKWLASGQPPSPAMHVFAYMLHPLVDLLIYSSASAFALSKAVVWYIWLDFL